MTTLDIIVTVGLFAAVALAGLALWFLSRPTRAQIAEAQRRAEIRAEADRSLAWQLNVTKFGALGKEANR